MGYTYVVNPFPPADLVTKSTPGPSWIPGDAKYAGSVMVVGFVWRISEDVYVCAPVAATEPTVVDRSWMDPKLLLSLVSMPTYDPAKLELVGGEATYTFISRRVAMLTLVTMIPRLLPDPFPSTLMVDPFKQLKENVE